VIPVEKKRAQIQMLRDGGFNIDYREYPKAHTVAFGQELPDIRSWITRRL
jgi:predicted esterase